MNGAAIRIAGLVAALLGTSVAMDWPVLGRAGLVEEFDLVIYVAIAGAGVSYWMDRMQLGVGLRGSGASCLIGLSPAICGVGLAVHAAHLTELVTGVDEFSRRAMVTITVGEAVQTLAVAYIMSSALLMLRTPLRRQLEGRSLILTSILSAGLLGQGLYFSQMELAGPDVERVLSSDAGRLEAIGQLPVSGGWLIVACALIVALALRDGEGRRGGVAIALPAAVLGTVHAMGILDMSRVVTAVYIR